MMTGWPVVVRLKCARSAGRCQGMALFLPIAPLRARATMRERIMFSGGLLRARGQTAMGALIGGWGS